MRGKSRSTKAAIEDAVNRVLEGGESIEQVAATSAVHVLTIRKYLGLRKAQGGMDPAAAAVAAAAVAPARRGRKPALNPTAEKELLEHVLQLTAQGAEVTSEQVLQLANDKVLQIHGESARRPSLTLSWLRRFKDRHPTLPLPFIPVSLDPNAVPLPPLSSSSSAAAPAAEAAAAAVVTQFKVDALSLPPAPPAAPGSAGPHDSLAPTQSLTQPQSQTPAPAPAPVPDVLSKRGRKPILDMQAELDIMSALKHLEAHGQRVTSDTILQLAREKVREVTGGATAPALSMSWLQRFKERHPSLFSDRVRMKRSREDDELGLAASTSSSSAAVAPAAAAASSSSSATAAVSAAASAAAMAPHNVRNVRPRVNDAFQSPLTAAVALSAASASNGRASPTTDELLKSLVRMNEKMVEMQKRQLEVLVQLVDAFKEKHV